jgi:hypothetical protein
VEGNPKELAGKKIEDGDPSLVTKRLSMPAKGPSGLLSISSSGMSSTRPTSSHATRLGMSSDPRDIQLPVLWRGIPRSLPVRRSRHEEALHASEGTLGLALDLILGNELNTANDLLPVVDLHCR